MEELVRKESQLIVKKEEEQLSNAKPDQIFFDIISHVENKYSCSGLCKKPLFYFTQSITKGPPKTPCLEPLVNDISTSMQNLGAAFLVSGIFFFCMIFVSIPICCYNKEQELVEEDVDDQLRGRRAEMYEVWGDGEEWSRGVAEVDGDQVQI